LVQLSPGRFAIDAKTVVVFAAGDRDAERMARAFAALVAPALGATPVVRSGDASSNESGTIAFGIRPKAAERFGSEGYRLDIERDHVQLVAAHAAGLFHGYQTLRQLLPASIEYRAALPRESALPLVRVIDSPRFAYRGALLDIGRHYYPLPDLERFVDLIALYKINYFHIHLTDDQGWRLEIRSRPALTANGGTTGAAPGSPKAYLTQDEYRQLVHYAADRFITIVPEVEMPAHSGAALAAYPDINCPVRDPKAPPGAAPADALCVDKDETYDFFRDVVREIAALSPGAYFHIGGDENAVLTADQYARFIERVQPIVRATGKIVIGWDEIARAPRLPDTIVEHWRPEFTHGHEQMRLLVSPAQKAYLDMKYDASTALGLDWAARIEVRDAYEWDPVTIAESPEAAIVGVEASLWGETIVTMADAEFLAFPRLPAIAEIAWSEPRRRGWDDFRNRLARQAPRWTALGINFYRSPQVPWTATEP